MTNICNFPRFSIGYTKIPTGSIDKNGRNVSGELAIEELREAVRKVRFP